MSTLLVSLLTQILAQLLPALEPLVVSLVTKLSKAAMDKLLAWVAHADQVTESNDEKREIVLEEARKDPDFSNLNGPELRGAVEAAVAKHRAIHGKGR